MIGIGAALRARGNAVALAANGHFAPAVRAAGLEFIEHGTEDEYRRVMDDPALWHRTNGFKTVFQQAILPVMPRTYEIVRAHAGSGRVAVVAAGVALGARVAQERLGVPMATVQLQPAPLRSVHENAVLPGLFMPRGMPRAIKRFLYWVGDVAVVDRVIAPGLNAFRAQVGLAAPVRRVLWEWWHSPRLAIGLFPAWYAPVQPDWPAQLTLTGFPLWDEAQTLGADEAVEEFLAEPGGPPIVFTPGSAMRHGERFFAESAQACRLLGRRGMLLTRFAEQIPRDLPSGVRHFAYVPFSRVLPRSAALVHHGGIGTAAQGLAAGVPHLVMPLSHDQPDNAARLRRLGVGDAVRPGRYRAARVAAKLRALLGSAEVAAACRDVAGRVAAGHGMEQTCALVEGLVG